MVEADPIKRMHDICRRQITSHQKDEGYFITYNSGKVIKVEDGGNKLITFGMSVEELIDQYMRFGNENK